MAALLPLRDGAAYLVRGFRMTAGRRRLFLSIAVVFSVPAFIAAGLAATVPPEEGWLAPALFLLQSITTAVAPAVFMMAVSAAYAAEEVPVWRVIRRAIPWLPRYLWTNVHTTLVFWVPVGALVLLREVIESSGTLPQNGGETLFGLAWWAALLLTALLLHSRTLLAPFLAVHSDLPATLAAWEAWRVSARHLPLIATTLLLSAAPGAVPLIIGVFLLLRLSPGPGLSEVIPQLTGAGLQLIRLIVVPAFYMLYRDLWYGTGAADEPAPCPPQLLRGIMALTARAPYRPAQAHPYPTPLRDSPLGSE